MNDQHEADLVAAYKAARQTRGGPQTEPESDDRIRERLRAAGVQSREDAERLAREGGPAQTGAPQGGGQTGQGGGGQHAEPTYRQQRES